jgi:hypothetical protein
MVSLINKVEENVAFFTEQYLKKSYTRVQICPCA